MVGQGLKNEGLALASKEAGCVTYQEEPLGLALMP